MNNKKENGNPYGAGQYGYTRSSGNSEAMIFGTAATFDETCGRWFEYMGCGYACVRDGIALQEADDADLYYFHRDNPTISCRESMYDLQYGDTREDVSYGFIFLAEYEATRFRTFSFSVDDISMHDMNEYIDAVEKWHITGEFNVGPYNGIPEYRPWEAK